MSNQVNATLLVDFLNIYCDVNAVDMLAVLKDNIIQKKIPEDKISLLKQQLEEAITKHTITPEQYKELTGDNEYNTQEELTVWFKDLQEYLFKDSH